MKKRSLSLLLVAALVLITLAVSCKDEPETMPVDVQITYSDGTSVEEPLSIEVGGTEQLNAKVLPFEFPTLTPSVEWEAEDPEVATVDETGLVTGVKVGATKIIVRAGNASDECIVNVIEVPHGI